MKIELIGKNVILKPMKKNDATRLFIYSKHPKLNQFSGPYMASKSNKNAEKYIEKCNKEIEQRKSYCLGIYNKHGKIIGTIGFFNLNKENKEGEVGFWISKDYWDKGYMTEAVKLMTNYIFNYLGYNEINAYIHRLNKSAKKVMQKSGYKEQDFFNLNSEMQFNEIIYSKCKQS